MNRFLLLLILIAITIQISFAVTDGDTHIRYIQNKGQWDRNILFKAELGLGNLYLEKNRFTYDLWDPQDMQNVLALKFQDPKQPVTNDQKIIHAHAFQMNFVGCNTDVPITQTGQATFFYNYFIGKDKTKWASGVHLYDDAKYENLYPGIDLRVYSKSNWIKYDFKIKPHSDASSIRLNYEGADRIFVEKGKLNIVTSVNTIIEQIPLAYQIIHSDTIPVKCEYRLDGTTVSFVIKSNVDPNYAVIIDPTVLFCTYSGSTADNWGFAATYDNDGNMYSGGIAFDQGYPATLGAYQTFFGGGYPAGGYSYGCDVSISKFDPSGTYLIYSTYLGGSGNELPHSMLVNSNNELIVFGTTCSTDFPVTTESFDSSFAGGSFFQIDNVIQFTGSDIYVTHFSADGTALIGSTYIGGTSNDGANLGVVTLKFNYADNARGEVMVDAQDNILIASNTYSADFPATAGAYQSTNAGNSDGLVCKFSPDLSQLLSSTYIGGSNDDAAYSLKVNDAGNIYVCGGTTSSNFPTSPGAIHTAFQGGITDGFVTELNSGGSAILHSTYLGTNDYDQAYILSIDDSENVYVFGQSLGSYPVTPSGVYSNSGQKQFIHKMDSTLSSTGFSTVVGTGNEINISPIAFQVDFCGNIYLAGWGGTINISYSGNGTNMGYTTGLPTTPDAFQSMTDGSDFYIMVLNPNAAALKYATFLGENGGAGEHVDGGTSRFSKNGTLYLAMCSSCGGTQGLPTTPGAWSSSNNSYNCNLGSAKFYLDGTGSVTISADRHDLCVNDVVHFSAIGNAAMFIWNFGDGTTSDLQNPDHTYLSAGTYTVTLAVNDSVTCSGVNNPLFDIIHVYANPIAGFSSLTIDSLVTFTDTSPNATSWLWNFGDGTGSTLSNPTHIYVVDAIYSVCLVAANSMCVDTICHYVTSGIDQSINGVSSVGNDHVIIYPNPASDYVTIKMPEVNSVITFYDLLGQKIKSIDLEPSAQTISTKYFAAGVYLYKISSADGSEVDGKLIVEH